MSSRIVLVTGSTTGIGEACARAFAALGDTIMVSGRNKTAGRSIVDELVRGGAHADFCRADFHDPAEAGRLVESTIERHGRLDVLVNNAGILYTADAVETSNAQWYETMNVNVHALFFASRAAVKQMLLQGGGAIVNIASEWGLNGEPRHVAYCASKGAVVQITRCMGLDHAKDNIRINAVCPGEVHTRMVDQILAKQGGDREANLRSLASGIPMRRIASPDEVARCVVFLASSQASYVTATTLAVDGGSDATAGAYP